MVISCRCDASERIAVLGKRSAFYSSQQADFPLRPAESASRRV